MVKKKKVLLDKGGAFMYDKDLTNKVCNLTCTKEDVCRDQSIIKYDYENPFKKYYDIDIIVGAINKYISKECAIYTIQEGQLSSNHNIGTVEHKKLLKEFPINKYKTIIPMLKYRIQNIHIYLKRYLKT